MKNRRKFLSLMATMSEIHNRQLSDSLLEIYWKVLEPWSDERCEEVFGELVRELKFFPKPADFIERLHNKPDWRVGPYKEYIGIEYQKPPEDIELETNQAKEAFREITERLNNAKTIVKDINEIFALSDEQIKQREERRKILKLQYDILREEKTKH